MTIWDVLDLPPDAERDAIRRAYAKKLKITHPEDDPEGFKQLREAYEAALAQADYRSRWAAYDEADEAEDERPAGDGDVWTELEAETPPLRDWSPAAPLPAAPQDDAAIATILAEREADLAQLREAMAALEAGLRGPWRASDGELDQRLQAILAAPALGEIRIRDDIEIWLAELIAETVPHSDAVLRQGIEAFGWSEEGQARHYAIAQALERFDEWRIIAALNQHGHEYHAGWRSLTGTPGNGFLWRIDAFRPSVRRGAAALLGAYGEVSPGLHFSFDESSVERWTAFFARPRLTLGILAQVPLLFFASYWIMYAVSGGEPPAVLLPIIALVACAAPVVTLFLLAPRRAALRERDSIKPWIAEGWVAAAMFAPVAAALLPGTWPVALALPALAIAIWAFLTRSGGPLGAAKMGTVWPFAGIMLFLSFAALDVLSVAETFALAVAAALYLYLRVYHRTDAAAILTTRLGRKREWWVLALVVGTLALGVGIVVLRSSWAPTVAFYPILLCILAVVLAVGTVEPGEGPPRWITIPLLALAFIVALVVSVPDKSPTAPTASSGNVPLAAGGTGDRRNALFDSGSASRGLLAMEEAQPAFAILRNGDPVLFAELKAELQKYYDGQATRDEAAAAFATRIDTAYRARLPEANAGLLVEGQRIRLSVLRALRKSNVDACAEEGSKAFDPDLLTQVQRDRQNAQIYNVIANPSVPPALQETAPPVSSAVLLDRTADTLGVTPAQATARLDGKQGVVDQCDARIAMLGVLVEMPQPNVAAMVRQELRRAARTRNTGKSISSR